MSRSEEIRDFYERMPYPAPRTSLDAHRDHYKNPDRRRADFHLTWPAEQPRGRQEILIAGCGTSQAARYALREPDARITAIDISETSLRRTRDLQRGARRFRSGACRPPNPWVTSRPRRRTPWPSQLMAETDATKLPSLPSLA